MITWRAWRLWLGIRAGTYDFPTRTKFNILKLVRLESKQICWVVFTLVTLVYIGTSFNEISQSAPQLVLITILLLVEGLNVSSGLSEVRNSRSVWNHLLKAVSILDIYINSPEILEDFGVKNKEEQKDLIEKRLKSMAEVAKSLRDEVNSVETADLAHNAMDIFIIYSDSCLVSGLTDKPGNQFFPKDKRSV